MTKESINLTKHDVINIDIQISQMNEAHQYFNRGKIKEFKNKYEGLVRIFKREVNEMQNEYFIIENGAIKVEGEGADRKFVTKEGKTIEAYSEAYGKWGSKIV